MPSASCSAVLLRLIVYQEQRELERLCQADELELGGGRQGLGDVPAIERTAEAHVRRA
jgi:hypothetical protein